MFVNDRLMYIQMAKTGTVRISEILQQVVGGQQMGRKHGYPEHRTSARQLIIGSIRNPWAWYVSLWAFGSTGQGGVLSWLKESDASYLELYADVNDPGLFRLWLERLYSEHYASQMRNGYERFSLRPSVGLMSYRYMYMYNAGMSHHAPLYFANYEQMVDYNREHNMVQAWIRLENLADDLIRCLIAAGHTLTEHAMTNIYDLSQIKSNSSPHRDYREYYDAKTARLVEERERLIVEQHRYSL